MFTSFAIIIQIYTFSVTQRDTDIQFYDTLFKSTILDTINYFKSNLKITYYYDQIFQPLHYNPNIHITNRDYSKEQQVTRIIIQNLSSIVVLLETDSTIEKPIKQNIKTKFDLFIQSLIKSPIFLENYQHIKPTLYANSLKTYLQQNFNI
jgi:hypothetical protein